MSSLAQKLRPGELFKAFSNDLTSEVVGSNPGHVRKKLSRYEMFSMKLPFKSIDVNESLSLILDHDIQGPKTGQKMTIFNH